MLGILIFSAVWEFTGRFLVDSQLLFAPLSAVLVALWILLSSGTLNQDLIVTGQELLGGYLLAAVGGMGVGSAFAIFPTLSRMFNPIVHALYATPIIAVTPLIILAVGIGAESKIVVVFLMAVFPILINTQSAFRSVDPDYIDTARAFQATRLQILRMVILPASVVTIVAGLRIAVGRAIVGMVVGELFGSAHGLGFRILQFSEAFQTAKGLAIVIILAALGVATNVLLEHVEVRLSPWQRERR